MAVIYHLNPETGVPGKCSAKIKCRFGENQPHFDNEELARNVFEANMESLTFASHRKPNLLDAWEDSRTAYEVAVAEGGDVDAAFKEWTLAGERFAKEDESAVEKLNKLAWGKQGGERDLYKYFTSIAEQSATLREEGYRPALSVPFKTEAIAPPDYHSKGFPEDFSDDEEVKNWILKSDTGATTWSSSFHGSTMHRVNAILRDTPHGEVE